MLLMAFFKPTPPEGDQRTFQVRPGMMETVVKGRLTSRLVDVAAADYERLGAAPLWVWDTVAVSSFETDIVRAGAAMLARVKKRGLKRLVGIIPSASLRMAARAASLTSGIDVRLVENRLEAAKFMRLDD